MTLVTGGTKPRLFGDCERTDNSPIALRESFYSLINPFNGRRAEQSRELYNCWCADYARDSKEDVHNRFSFGPLEHRQKVLFDKNAIWHPNHSARKTPAAVIFVADTHSYGVLGTQTLVYTNLLVNPDSLLPALSRRHPRRTQSGVSLHQRAVIPNL